MHEPGRIRFKRMNNRALFPLFGSVLLALLVVSLSAGAPQRSKWWQDENVKRKVGLTDDQARKIEDIFMASMPDLARSKRELDRLERELVSFADSSADEVALRQRIDRVETARAELNKLRSMMLFRMRRILTLDQRVKLETIQRDRDGMHERPNHSR